MYNKTAYNDTILNDFLTREITQIKEGLLKNKKRANYIHDRFYKNNEDFLYNYIDDQFHYSIQDIIYEKEQLKLIDKLLEYDEIAPTIVERINNLINCTIYGIRISSSCYKKDILLNDATKDLTLKIMSIIFNTFIDFN